MLKLLIGLLFQRAERAVFTILLTGLCGLGSSASGAGLSVMPSAVSNSYNGVLTLQITGLTNGEPVTIERYLDLNTNGTVDVGESLIDAFPLADGGVSIIGGITNLNVPYDRNPAGGAITATLSLVASLDVVIGQHIFRLSSPSGNFSPQTSLFTITNAALNPSITGTVFNGVSPVPHAIVVVFAQPHNTFVGAVVANGAGQYGLKVPPGTYGLFPVFPNYYTDQSKAARVTLTNGAAVAADLFLTNGSVAFALSGQITDATNGRPLGGVFLQFESGDLFSIGFTDSSGNYSAPLTSSFWQVRAEGDDTARRGYVGPQEGIQADLTAGSVANVNFAFPKANALFYGRIVDSLGVPFGNLRFSGDSDADARRAGGVSDTNGNYVVAVLASTNRWFCNPGNHDNLALLDYIISSGLEGTAFTNGQSVRQDFVALRATAQITGRLADSLGNSVSDVNVSGNAQIGGISYNTSATTDDDGKYRMPAAQGTWSLFLNCCGNEGLDNYGLYDPVYNGHRVSIPPTNAVLNITVYPAGTPLLSEPRRLSPTQVGFVLSGLAGAECTIQASTNLSISNWFNLYTLNLTSSVMFLQDNQATNIQRFYRALKN